jgi:hypothetical protein
MLPYMFSHVAMLFLAFTMNSSIPAIRRNQTQFFINLKY